jgi:hypothetical protein
MNRARIRMQTVSSVWVVHGKRPAEKISWLQAQWAFQVHVLFADRVQFVPERESAGDDESDEKADQKEPTIRRQRDQ